MSNGRGFVELGRRFRKLDPRSRAEALALDSYTTAQWGGSSLLSWDDLLKERLVVLLGEPGSGKTWEMEERVRLLNATGRCAFFIRLERLVTEPLGQVLAPVDAQRFEAWHKGTSEAIFFLDSVDETKLHRIADFGTALDKFRSAVGDRGVARASILVSSRISEWRPESDAHAVRTRVRFPPWFPELVAHQRSAVSEVICECVRGEWQLPAGKQHAHEVIADLVYHGENLFELVADTVEAELRQADPQNDQILEFVLSLLLRTVNRSRSVLLQLAPHRAVTAPVNSRAHSLWLATWLQLDAGPALDFILDAVHNEADGEKLAMAVCAILSGDNHGLHTLPDPDYMKPQHVRRLAPFIYQHMHKARFTGEETVTAHFLGPADYAYRFRDGLLQRLSQSGDPEAERVLRLLADEPVFRKEHDWILHLADMNSALHADLFPWNPQDVRDFSDNYETDPKTADDLFRIACRRLGDIKHYVEKAENSLREEINPTHDELALRRWFARKLTERSRDRYTAPQEEEIDQRKRLDIRLNRPGIEPVPIELKWADKWTVAELVDGLESQLVGLYLRADTAKYGIYLLANIGRKQGWQSPDCDKQMQFGEVLSLMEARANEIAAKDNHVRQIAVIGVDFRPPSTITAQVPKVQSTFALDERARVGNDAAP